jgi:hypothetical protein
LEGTLFIMSACVMCVYVHIYISINGELITAKRAAPSFAIQQRSFCLWVAKTRIWGTARVTCPVHVKSEVLKSDWLSVLYFFWNANFFFSYSRIPRVLWNTMVSTMFIQLRLWSASCIRWIQPALISPSLFKTHVVITAISICRSCIRFLSFRNFHWSHVCIFPMYVTGSDYINLLQFNFLIIQYMREIEINIILITHCSWKYVK